MGVVALVALNEATSPDVARLRDALLAASPRSDIALTRVPPDTAADAMAIDIDGHRFGAATHHGPLPEPETGNAIRSSVFWPEADDVLARHAAFLAVGAARRENVLGLVRAQAVALTRLLSVLVQTLPASGILWRSAGSWNPPDRIRRAVVSIDEGRWPLDIWFGWQFIRQKGADKTVMGLQTRGAADYLGFELALDPLSVRDPKELLRILAKVAGYLMDRGSVIPDGQLLNIEGQRPLRYQMHPGGGGQPALARLTLDNASQPGQG